VSKPAAPAESTITISLLDKGVRFTALGNVAQTRLEVFSPSGASLYNSDFKAGSVQDWALADQFGQPLPDGSYLCVLTTRDLSGRLSTKQGTVLVQGGAASLKLGAVEPVGTVEADKALTPVTQGEAPALSLLTHDGSQGRLISGRGGLSFATGDFFAGKEQEHLRLTAEGKLGVGVSDPQAKLDVAGTIRTSEGIVFPDGSVQTTAYVASGRQLSGLSERGALQRDAQGRPIAESGERLDNSRRLTPETTGSGSAGKLAKWAGSGGAATDLLEDSALTQLNGNIGIGTTNPSASFHASRSDGSYQYKMERTGTNARIYGFGADSNGNFFLDDVTSPARRLTMDTTGNVGVGTTNPSASFHASRSDGSYQYKMERTGANAHVYGFGADSSGNFFLDDVTSAARRLTLDTAGNIQTTGSFTVLGNIAAKYQDMAEWVPASQQLAAGTVVSLDVKRSNTVMASARAYDTHIAGVVSPQPGVILGEGGAGKVLVATTGRVKVKVDASQRSIKVGDLLVASGKPGVAMKSAPVRVGGRLLHRPGTIIGKALEPLAKGQGEILVLLSLQ
jgi:hypothetical protein